MTVNSETQGAVIIERGFDAPVELVWQMWTDPHHFRAWYGPNGATVPVAKMDVRVGGTRLVCMEVQSPSGARQMWFTGQFREVVENALLVYTESMSDESGNLISPEDMGMPQGHPVTTEVRVQLQKVGNATKLTLTHVGVPGDSAGAAGWATALDKLASYAQAHVVR